MTGRVLSFAAVVVSLALLLGRAVDVEFATGDAQAHLVRVPDRPSRSLLENRAASQRANVLHAQFVCRHGGGQHRRWACWAASSVIRAGGQGWLRRELRRTMNALRPATVPSYESWVAVQIRYATLIAQASAGDPWPNCADPFDGSGASWLDTVACENGGDWLDSPGFYRCGLQFDPMWERFYGRRFCP